MMPQVNLSALNGRDLRQLLDSSRRRGDAALSYKILQEMAERREHPAERGPFMTLRPSEPRLVAVEMGDPMDKHDPPPPDWRPPAHDPEEAASPPRGDEAVPAMPPIDAEPPPPPVEPSPPLTLRDPDPPPFRGEAADPDDLGLRLQPAETPSRPARRRPRLRLAAGLALGIPIGIALGWWANGVARDTPAPSAPAAPLVQTTALTPQPAPVPAPLPPSAEAAPAPDASGAPDPAVAAPPPDLRGEAAPPPGTLELAPRVPEAVTTAEPAEPATVGACEAAPTPADREICGDAQLRRLQGELRRAYAEALDAHQDRALLRQRQLAWRDARNPVSDPARLAQLYRERIRKLNAATAAARQQR